MATPLPAVAGDAVTDDLDTSQLLDVDGDEFSGAVSLIAVDRRLGIQVLEPRQALTGRDAGHRRRAGADSRGDLQTGLAPTPQPKDLQNHGGMGLAGRVVGTGAAIHQRRLAGLLIPAPPFRSSPTVNAGHLGGADHGHACLNALDHQQSTGRATSGILAKLHLGSSDELVASPPDSPKRAQMDNYLMGTTC
jgi:hypothetical protein